MSKYSSNCGFIKTRKNRSRAIEITLVYRYKVNVVIKFKYSDGGRCSSLIRLLETPVPRFDKDK